MNTGVDKITDKILAEAREKADGILKRAEEFAAEQRTASEKQRRELMEDADQRGKRDAATMGVRADSLIQTQARKADLSVRQQAIGNVIEAAVDKLNQRPAEERIAFYAGLIKQANISEGEILLGKAEQDIAEGLAKALGDRFTVADKPANIKGGILIRRGNILDNLSYDLCIRNNRPQYSAAASKVLFDGMD